MNDQQNQSLAQVISGLPDQINRGGYSVRLFAEFSYTVNFPALAPSAAATNGSFITQNDSDFLWLGTSWAADIGGATGSLSTQILPLVVCQLLYVAEPFQDAEQPLTGIASGPQEPLRLQATPFWIAGGATFSIKARNYSLADTYDLWITFHGVKYKLLS